MPLFRDVQPGDVLRIGDTSITIEQKTGQRTRLRIDSPHDVEHVKAGARPAMTRPDMPEAAPRAAPQPAPPAEPKPRLTMPPIALPA